MILGRPILSSLKKYWVHAFLLISVACVDSYTPQVLSYNLNLLVVDGFINSGSGPTQIRLSRTQNIAETGKAKPELHAEVIVEREDGAFYALTDSENSGTYSGNVTIMPQHYRLKITTKDQKTYRSEFVEIKNTPAIDDVNWRIENNGIKLYVNTHDAHEAVGYYQWEFEETWHFRSEFCTNLEYKNGKIVAMDPFIDIHNCWQTDKPKDKILIASTSSLSENRVSQFPITFVSAETEKMGIRYSILVRQYSVTRENFEYLQALRKNTEELGSIFDPQPSHNTGNVVNVNDPLEQVLGYVGAHNMHEQRIFIARSELQDSLLFTVPPKTYCYDPVITTLPSDSVSYLRTLTVYYENAYVLPINPSDSLPPVLKLTNIPFAQKSCVDCRLRGTNVKPDFWVDTEVYDGARGCNF